jgi:CPA1 family monovalent cation:H+ antiporter
MAAGEGFPERGLILLVTFCVILVTLVGQGASFPWLVTKLGLVRAGNHQAMQAKQHEIAARIEGIDAALRRLDAMERAGEPDAAIGPIRRRQSDRRGFYVAAASKTGPRNLAAADAAIQLAMVDAERHRITELYIAGRLTDEARRRVERELDLEDSRIRHAAESGAGCSL